MECAAAQPTLTHFTPQWEADAAGVKTRRRYLIKQRRKAVEIEAVDNDDVPLSFVQAFDEVESGKTSADDHKSLFVRGLAARVVMLVIVSVHNLVVLIVVLMLACGASRERRVLIFNKSDAKMVFCRKDRHIKSPRTYVLK